MAQRGEARVGALAGEGVAWGLEAARPVCGPPPGGQATATQRTPALGAVSLSVAKNSSCRMCSRHCWDIPAAFGHPSLGIRALRVQ